MTGICHGPVFVFAPGRSGTKFLSRLLDLSPDLVMRHEAYASVQIKLFGMCSIRAGCERRSCSLHGTVEDQSYLADLLQVIAADQRQLHRCRLQLGESSSHLALFAPEVCAAIPEARLILPLRHPLDGAASAMARGKWASWPGRLDGRCRYCNSWPMPELAATQADNMSFADHWLALWCATWQRILAAASSMAAQICALRLDRLEESSALSMFERLDLPINPLLVRERYSLIGRNSSFHNGDGERRRATLATVAAEAHSSIREMVVRTLEDLESSRLWADAVLTEAHRLSPAEWKAWRTRL